MASRFDYVKYDEDTVDVQNVCKALCQELEAVINNIGMDNGVMTHEAGRGKASALTKLEECYMWIGKALRDDQIRRNDGAFDLQEERKDG